MRHTARPFIRVFWKESLPVSCHWYVNHVYRSFPYPNTNRTSLPKVNFSTHPVSPVGFRNPRGPPTSFRLAVSLPLLSPLLFFIFDRIQLRLLRNEIPSRTRFLTIVVTVLHLPFSADGATEYRFAEARAPPCWMKLRGGVEEWTRVQEWWFSNNQTSSIRVSYAL